MRLYIIRHADPDYRNDTITAAGHLEAQALARRLAGCGLDRIYSSPMQRARHTMQYTADLVKLPFLVEEWMQEFSEWRIETDAWGRMMVWDLPGETIRAQQPLPTHDTWRKVPHFDAPMFQEGFERLQESSDEFLENYGYKREGGRYRILEANRLQIAVFCHHGLGVTWLAHLLAIPLPLMWCGFWLPPSSVTTVLFDERSEEWAVPRCLGMADVSHLYQARLPVQPRGVKANFF